MRVGNNHEGEIDGSVKLTTADTTLLTKGLKCFIIYAEKFLEQVSESSAEKLWAENDLRDSQRLIEQLEGIHNHLS